MRKCFAIFALTGATAFGATLIWDPNPETDLAGYYVYTREGTNQTAQKVNVGLVTRYPLTNGFPYGTPVQFNVSAHNLAGLESDLSETLVWTPAIGLPQSPTITTNFAHRVGDAWNIGLTWKAPQQIYGVSGYWIKVVWSGSVVTNFFTDKLSANFTIPVQTPTDICVMATNYYGLSSAVPVVTYRQPSAVRTAKVLLP